LLSALSYQQTARPNTALSPGERVSRDGAFTSRRVTGEGEIMTDLKVGQPSPAGLPPGVVEDIMRRLLYRALVFVVFSAVSVAKDRAWRTGTLVDSQTQRDTRTVGIPPTIITGPKVATLRNDITYYTIDDGKYRWVVSRRMTKEDDKPLNVTIDAPVKFAIENKHCYLLDDEGEEHKLTLERKTLKTN